MIFGDNMTEEKTERQLREELTKKRPQNQVLYFIVGTVLGVGLTLGTSYAYSYIVN